MAAEQAPLPATEARHSIAVVSRRTGVTQLVLRAWERRYGAVLPARTPTGRRLYTDQDVEKIALLHQLTAIGHRIGDVANLGIGELRALVAEDSGGSAVPGPPTKIPGTVDEYLTAALAAIVKLDAQELNRVLDKALVDLSKPMLRKNLIVPLLTEIGERWGDGRLRISHEHMATSIVGTFLAAMNARQQARANAPLVAVATPSGQFHELGALMAASVALEKGWDALYLGRDLPAEDMASAVRARGAQALLLSLVFPHGDAAVMTELRQLRQLVGAELPIIVGGQAADSYGVALAEICARIVHNEDELQAALADF